MATDNIFSGLKVVDFASFIAAHAAVILSDFGAAVIKVEPPSGDLWRHGHEIHRSRRRRTRIPGTGQSQQARHDARSESPSAQQVLKQLVKWATTHRQHAASRNAND